MSSQPALHPVLLIGATDSSGGAGLGQDIVAVQYASQFLKQFIPYRLAVSSVTVQSCRGVTAIHPVPVSVFEQQLFTCTKDSPVSAIKIGMISNEQNNTESHLDILVRFLESYQNQYGKIPVILDPVFKASTGGSLQNESFLRDIQNKLFPFVTVLTPNLNEFQTLHPSLPKKGEYSTDEIQEYLKDCSSWKALSVLLKGGHLILKHQDDKVLDILAFFQKNSMQLTSFSRPRRPFVTDRRGTGCFLATTLAICLSQYSQHTFDNLCKAVQQALTIFDGYHA